MSTNDHKEQPSAEYLEGVAAGFDEATADRWTPDLARRYFEQVGAPINEFDAGYQEGIRQALRASETTRS